ncbi:CHAT domain-containing protein [Nostoc punctiforme]|uniref:TPR repeat-containing protein n=1 Tax=Nostoc punctiforme (strain ATCC 29133 / PCC 73102) TaxID=63737 RepID=B2JAL6_NOSP7|nr:CHAT domain-containing tetratricopeptide repeat protein [Nostoc punctiforme]ACC84970.1 TPR repeat-containing protein [Nostoc punctiforme PCC 73102]
MHHRLKYLTVATVLFPLVTLSPCLPLSSPLVVQAQTTQQPSAEALQLLQIGIQQYKNGALQEALQTFQKLLPILRTNGNEKIEAMTLNVIGRIYVNLGYYPQALTACQQALALVKQIGEKAEEGASLNNIGNIYNSWGQSAKALEFYQQALTISKQIDDKLLEGLSLNNIGTVYSSWGEYAKALEFYQQALVIYKQVGNKMEEATTFNNIGNIYNSWGEYTKALEAYQQALAIVKQASNKVGEASTLNNIGLTYNSQGNYNKALELHQQALAILQQLDNKREEATTLSAIGLAYNKQGQYVKAVEFHQQALTIFKHIGNKWGEAATLNNIGDVYRNLGEYTKALGLFQQASAIFKQIADQAGEGTTLNNIAFVYNNQGQYAKALAAYQQALAIRKQINQKALVGESLNNIGSVYDNLGQSDQALKFYQQALAIFKQIGSKAGEGKSLNNIAFIYNNSEQYDKALKFYQESLTILQQIGDKAGEGKTFHNIGEVYQRQRQYIKAFKIYQESLSIFKQIGDKAGEGITLNNIGGVYYNQGEYAKALEFHQEALAIVKQVGDKAAEGTYLNNIGSAYEKLGQYDNAEKTLFTAIEIWEDLRKNGLTDAHKISIFEKQAETYRFLQKALIAQNKINSALEVSDRAKSRAFIELLASKQLEKPNPLLNIKPLALQQIKNVAKVENATLVQYSIIGNEALYIWVIKPTGEIAFEQVDLKKSLNTSLENLVINNRKTLGVRSRGIKVEPKSGGNQKQQLQKLYEILIKPIAQYLPKDSNARVIFVSQESLFLVPFPALQDEQGEYLIDKHTILTVPAIQVLDLTTKQKHNLNKSAKDVLVIGNPIMPKIPITNEQLSSLPGAETEAIQIADLFKTKAIIGSKATETAIVPKMSKARIIHFATHGLLDDFKGFGVPGAIAFAPSNQDDGFLTSGEILDMKLNAELIVLSACNTGGGNITGDGVIGLSRSLITAGVPSVIVSLWDVNDNSTAFLMSEFYDHFQQNPDKAVALRKAMLTTKKRYTNPLYWAAFTLIGEAD